MQVVVERVAGLDVHKRPVTGCARIPEERAGKTGRRSQTRTFRTFAKDLEELREWLGSLGVTVVVMESTGVYWKPVWYALEGHFQLLLVNARHVARAPGRKTDVTDAAWLAELAECGLLAGSFVPPPPIRQLRDLTRYRTRLVQARGQETQRVDKCVGGHRHQAGLGRLRHAGVSGRAICEALIAGESDPDRLAALARGRLRAELGDLRLALAGSFGEHHRVMLRLLSGHIDHLDAAIAAIDDRVDAVMAPFTTARQRLTTIPGVGKRAAEVIIAEIGVDMAVFAAAAHLASWAGLCPGNHESAGKRRSGRTRHGDTWLRALLVQCAWSAARTRDTYLSAQFWQIARRRGKERAAVAVAHTILVAAHHLPGR